MDAGHNKYAPGASSFLDEVAENRKVHKQLTADLKASGFVVNNCTDDSGRTADDVLYNIVVKSNKFTADLHISLHLNSDRKDKIGDGKTGGTEVFNYDERTKALSDLICKQIAADLGITNRGTKYEPEYYVLRKTNALAILIECCFTDDKDDYKKWDAIKCAHAIAKAVCAYYGVAYKGGSASIESKPSTSKPTTSTSSTAYYKMFNSTSIVDGLKSIGVDSSMSNRMKIAAANGISSYTGTASQNEKLLSLARAGKLKKSGSTSGGSSSSTSYYKSFNNTSIVDGLKGIGVDSGFNNRKAIAKANGISGYTGTSEQNQKLLSLARKGKLKKA